MWLVPNTHIVTSNKAGARVEGSRNTSSHQEEAVFAVTSERWQSGPPYAELTNTYELKMTCIDFYLLEFMKTQSNSPLGDKH